MLLLPDQSTRVSPPSEQRSQTMRHRGARSPQNAEPWAGPGTRDPEGRWGPSGAPCVPHLLPEPLPQVASSQPLGAALDSGRVYEHGVLSSIPSLSVTFVESHARTGWGEFLRKCRSPHSHPSPFPAGFFPAPWAGRQVLLWTRDESFPQ